MVPAPRTVWRDVRPPLPPPPPPPPPFPYSTAPFLFTVRHFVILQPNVCVNPLYCFVTPYLSLWTKRLTCFSCSSFLSFLIFWSSLSSSAVSSSSLCLREREREEGKESNYSQYSTGLVKTNCKSPYPGGAQVQARSNSSRQSANQLESTDATMNSML